MYVILHSIASAEQHRVTHSSPPVVSPRVTRRAFYSRIYPARTSCDRSFAWMCDAPPPSLPPPEENSDDNRRRNGKFSRSLSVASFVAVRFVISLTLRHSRTLPRGYGLLVGVALAPVWSLFIDRDELSAARARARVYIYTYKQIEKLSRE